MSNKICFRCRVEKPLSDYYVHKLMSDGHVGKCKECAKKDTKERVNVLSKNPEWVEKERARVREKAARLYRKSEKPYVERNVDGSTYVSRYPEKYKAKNLAQHMEPEIKGNHLHHWSYRTENAKDTIELTVKDHYRAHRFIIYDQEQMMYRRTDNNELLDTRESHEKYIRDRIENM